MRLSRYSSPSTLLWRKAQQLVDLQYERRRLIRSFRNHSSTRLYNTNTTTRSTLYWCSRIVFGSSKRNVDTENLWTVPELSVQSGGVLVNPVGIIEECFPGISREEAQSMARSTSGLDSSSRVCQDFIDLTKVGKSMTTDCMSLCLSPGLIDVHTHISSLGRDWEGYTTATAAAAAGGITTIIGMPLNSLPPTVSVREVQQELEYAHSESTHLHVDVGLWGGVLPETAGEEQQLHDLLSHPNVLGIKAFLSPLPPGAGYQAISPNQLLDVAKLCGTYEKPILVHSELMTGEEQKIAMDNAYPNDGRLDDSHRAHVASRPVRWEQDAVKVVIEASEYCDMHVVHLSDGIGCLPLIHEAKRKTKNATNFSGRKLTVETCPHYLIPFFDDDDDNDKHNNNKKNDDRRVKCFPPIRGHAQRQRLWKGLLDGDIDMIASDHSPCEPMMRHGDIMSSSSSLLSMKTAWGGLSGLQYQLPATWTAALIGDTVVKNTSITEKEMAEWWSVSPSRLVGLDDRGSIEPGKRADFVLWDTAYVGAPDRYAQEYHRWKGDSVYSSRQDMCGRVLGTWLKGKQIYDGLNDELLLNDQGKYIHSQK
jgi:allantoinase